MLPYLLAFLTLLANHAFPLGDRSMNNVSIPIISNITVSPFLEYARVGQG